MEKENIVSFKDSSKGIVSVSEENIVSFKDSSKGFVIVSVR